MFKKLFSDAFLYAIGPQIPKVVGIFLLPVLTQYLTTKDYAVYGISMAYIGGLQGLRELGMSQVLINHFYKNKEGERNWRHVWREIFGLLHIWGIFYSILLGLVLYWTMAPKIGAEIWTLLALVLLPAFLFEITINSTYRYLQINQKPLPVAINSTIAGILSIVVTYVSIVHFQQHYLGFFWAQFVASLFSFLFFAFPFYIRDRFYPNFRFSLRKMKPHFRVALPTIPHNYSTYLLSTSDRVILDFSKVPINAVGQYNFAYNFGNYVDMIGSALGTAVGPFYLRFYVERSEQAERNVRFLTYTLQYLFLIGSMLLGLWCKEILAILSSNPQLSASYPLAIVIIMSYCYRPMYWETVCRLGFEEKTQHLWKISFLGGLINIVLNLILIPVMGIYATVLSTFIGLMYIGFAGFFLRAYKMHSSKNYNPLLWLGIITIVSLFTYFERDASVLFKSVVSGGVVFLSIGLARYYRHGLVALNASGKNTGTA